MVLTGVVIGEGRLVMRKIKTKMTGTGKGEGDGMNERKVADGNSASR